MHCASSSKSATPSRRADGQPPALGYHGHRCRWREDRACRTAQVVRRLIVVMLFTAAALDLTRCGLVMAAARYPAPTAGLVTAGLAAATLTARTARGCRAGHRWAGWAALLIGAASAPQAAVSGFRSPYTIPDTATAVLGMLLAIIILATAGRMDRRDTTPHIPVCWTGEPRCGPERSRVCTSSRSTGCHRVRRWVLNVLVDVPGRLPDLRRAANHYRPRASQQLGRQVAEFVLHHLRSASAEAR